MSWAAKMNLSYIVQPGILFGQEMCILDTKRIMCVLFWESFHWQKIIPTSSPAVGYRLAKPCLI